MSFTVDFEYARSGNELELQYPLGE